MLLGSGVYQAKRKIVQRILIYWKLKIYKKKMMSILESLY